MSLIQFYFWFQFIHVAWTAVARYEAPHDRDKIFSNGQDANKVILERRISSIRKMSASPITPLISDVTNENSVMFNYEIEKNNAIKRIDRNEVGYSLNSSEIAAVTEAERRQFGRRGFGPLSRFQVKKNSGMEWIGYFYEEAFLPVLQTHDRLLVDCTIIEVRQDWEQEEAMKFLGGIMTMYPLSLSDMVHLITLCGSIHSQHNAEEEARHFSSSIGGTSARPPFSTLIFPGTLWCGMKDNAETYEDLGDRLELDRCCRAHDHCPVKLGSFEGGRYGISSSGFATKSHCLCELEFFRCLKGAKSQTADLIGNFYFNVLNVDCLEKKTVSNLSSQKEETSFRGLNPINSGVEQIYKCVEWDSNRKCRYWEKKENMNNYYTTSKFKLRY